MIFIYFPISELIKNVTKTFSPRIFFWSIQQIFSHRFHKYGLIPTPSKPKSNELAKNYLKMFMQEIKTTTFSKYACTESEMHLLYLKLIFYHSVENIKHQGTFLDGILFSTWANHTFFQTNKNTKQNWKKWVQLKFLEIGGVTLAKIDFVGQFFTCSNSIGIYSRICLFANILHIF